ncbi:hypothetical protein MON38_12380 [Hymenobacter sp. DH14]|uniref:Uncharacterized protein n=1 Tax=Hymenobacter cyanobacteriorum TaxID=2926463 RepID=A0A9X1VGJ1_9BACT|nr:hypothetical protein [Hymenobacter cyanobacteriorum]MCI1188218.1 hypothetical protein [Hymenobacter cyanobacteriorum]
MTRTHASRTGLVKWRQLALRRRGVALVLIAQSARAKPVAGSRRYLVAAPVCPVGKRATIRIGEFVISPEGDPRILGHPQIRY